MISKWHSDWQKRFLVTEKMYICDNGNRRADAVVNDLYVIEFQHSFIKKTEVDAREYDYKSVGKTVVWVVDGDGEDFVCMNDDRVFVDFKNVWKYDSFMNCEQLFIHIHDAVYAMHPQKVKSQMTELIDKTPIDDFVTGISEGTFLQATKNANQLVRTRVYIKQQGAGNGKTYGVVQLITDPVFAHIHTFVYLTKQHSAKFVIKQEIEDQRKRDLLHVTNISEPTLVNNKYIITFQHDEVTKKIIIGTFDSFVYALGDKNIKGLDLFQNMVMSILDHELRCNKNGTVDYAGGGIRLNKQLLLIGDEMQDLEINYAKTLLKISREKYVDVYAVGDKLQSISFQNNALTYLMDYEFPEPFEMIRFPYTNVNRRILGESRGSMIPFINRIVPFETFGLPPIEQDYTEQTNESVVVITGKNIYKDDHDEEKITQEVNTLMDYYEFEVNNNGRKPSDFLIVTSFVQRNPLVEAFHTAIRKFWENRQDIHRYTQWSVFHKSEDGRSIDLEESSTATRIVSIHSSKGDGRPVVFVMNMCEAVLKKYSDVARNLVYESLLHVALTRAKEKMYIWFPENGCDISRRFHEAGGVSQLSLPNKLLKFDLDTILENNENVYNEFKSVLEMHEPDIKTGPSEIIDVKHHVIRGLVHYTMTYLCVYETFKATTNKNHQHIYMILKELREFTIKPCDSTEYHKKISKICIDKIIPILNYKSYGGDYKKYHVRVMQSINKIQKSELKSDNLDPIDMVVLGHLIQLYMHKEYTPFPITDLYDIVHVLMTSDPTGKQAYVEDHYRKLAGIRVRVRQIHEKYPDMKFAISNYVEYKGGSKDVEIGYRFSMIGRNKDTALLFKIQPQLNKINMPQTLLNAVFYTHLARNSNKDLSTHTFDFENKQIRVCVLAFDHDPVYLDFPNLELTNTILQREIRRIMLDERRYHEQVYERLLDVKDPMHELSEIIKNTKKPNYITRYITGLDERIQDVESPGEFLSELLSDKQSFLHQLDKRLDKALGNFFKPN